MSVRQSLVIFALAATGLSVAHAQSTNTSTWVGGEIGFVASPAQSTMSREQVRQELLAFQAAPIAADGGRYVGGEAGYVPEQHVWARVDGRWVSIDNIAHNAKPEAVKSDAENRLFLQLYPA